MTQDDFNKKFDRFTTIVEHAVGSPWAFVLAVLVVVVWAAFGPYFEWSDSHQLWINTSTTIVTFWLVFLIQSTQTKSTLAIQLKLDELIRAIGEARSNLVNIEERTAEEIAEEKAEIARLAREQSEE